MNIQILDHDTINRIAAGEVIERPASIVKELTENAVDAGSSAVTVEIKDGGISLIRVTDNGCGIPKEEVRTAFLRHATSKIRSAEDLFSVRSLGFRGEALSSIAAVCRTEIITKPGEALTGTRFVIEGGKEKIFEDVGTPEGTTIIARDIFFHTPARRKFLKTPATEAAHIASLTEHLALSHPDISFLLIVNGVTRFHTSGNGNLKDIIYQIYGRDTANALLPVHEKNDSLEMEGFLGKPEISRGNRDLEIYCMNGRVVKSNIIAKAIEDGYGRKMMQHQYPFSVLLLSADPGKLDVNVHPSKQEIRFSDPQAVYGFVSEAVNHVLSSAELIRTSRLTESAAKQNIPASSCGFPSGRKVRPAEPFEEKRTEEMRIRERETGEENVQERFLPDAGEAGRENPKTDDLKPENLRTGNPKQEELRLLTEENRKSHRLVGEIFDTYWIVEFNRAMYMIDQHAAHEKVLYERLLKQFQKQEVTSQMLMPPFILTLSDKEEVLLKVHSEEFRKIGYEMEPFGGHEIAVRSVPDILPSVLKEDLLKEMIGSLSEETSSGIPDLILEKTASMACKAAVKGNRHISAEEAEILIDELLCLDNPYNCPHGRPTIIKITQNELEKKFKRIVS